MATLVSAIRGRGGAASEAARGRDQILERSARWRSALLLTPLLLLIFTQPFFRPTDPDYWTHARTGAWILAHHAIPRVDPFSFSVAGTPWVTHEWLTEVVMAVTARFFGYAGNAVIFGFVGAASQLVLYLSARRRGVGQLGSVTLLIWGYLMASGLFAVVPQVLSILFLALCAYVLIQYRNGKSHAVWFLPPLLGVWGNLHGGFAVGFGLIGLTIAGETLARRLGQPSAPTTPLIWSLAASLLTTLLNPNGPRVLVYSFTEGGPFSPAARFVTNFQPPNFHDLIFLPFLAAVILSLSFGLQGGTVRPTDTLWALALSILGLQSARHVALYAVVVLPILGQRLAEILPAFRDKPSIVHRPWFVVATWIVIVTTLGRNFLPGRQAGLQLGWEPDSGTFYPSAGVRYLETHPAAERVFSEYAWGGYLIYQLYPTDRVFIDGRIDIYGNAFVAQFLNTIQGGPRWNDLLDRYDIQTVLIDRHDALAALLANEPGWREAFRGPVEVIYVRVTPTGDPRPRISTARPE